MANKKINILKTLSRRLLIVLLSLSAFFIAFLAISFYVKSDAVFTPLMPVFVGAIGGLVGLQRRFKLLDDDDLELLSSSWIQIFLSPFIGGILAVLLYILFLSNLLGGKLFPTFSPDAIIPEEHRENFLQLFDMHGVNAEDYAKLVFWSFVAGFSEKFVINVIRHFQQETEANSENG